jgi:uncharacterized protein YegL
MAYVQPVNQDMVNHVVFVLDISGSMDSISEVSKNNFNEQLAKLREESHDQETYVTLVMFDHNTEVVYKNKPIAEVPMLDVYPVRGMTALYDALGVTLANLERDVPQLMDSESEHAALVIVITDGQENSSTEFTHKQLKATIERLEETDNWTFTFLGANIDVEVEAGAKLSFAAANTMSFSATVSGVAAASAHTTSGINKYYLARRSGQKSIKDFYDD